MSDCNCCLDQLLEPDPQDVLVVINNNGSLGYFEDGQTPIGNGATQVDVSFVGKKANDQYTFNELDVKNFLDPSPLAISAQVILQTENGFSVLLSGVPDTANYVLRWEVAVTQA